MNYEIIKNMVISKMNKRLLIVLLGVVCIGIIVVIVIMNNKSSEFDFINFGKIEDKDSTEDEQIVDKSYYKTIKVHIDGEVIKPGVVEIEEESRLEDAIKKAGGVTPNACLKNINLAAVLEDGQKIYIPNNEENENGNYYIQQNKSSKVNINTANSEELQKINGVGENLAEKIIEYRVQNGKFKQIDELKNVSGIGDKKFESISDEITI